MKDINVPAGYKSTDIGVIPEDWKIKKLKYLIKIINGFAFKSEFFSNNGVIVLTPGNFKLEGGLYFNEKNTKRYSSKFPLSTKFNFGDLLIVMTDLTRECNLLGKPAFIDTHETILHNQRIGKIEILTNEVINNFIFYFFLSNYYHLKVKETATGSTVRHTSNRSIYDISFSLPPLSEQKAIARVLSDVDELIRECDSLLTKKRDIKQGTMQQLLTGKQRLPGFSGEWEITKFNNITNSITCGLAATPKYVKEEIGKPFLSAQNVRNGKVVYRNYKYVSTTLFHQITKNNKPEKGDLLYTRVGAGIGEAGVIEDNFEFGIYVSLTLIKVKYQFLHNYYLLHLLNSPQYKALAKNGQFAGGGVQNLNVEIVREFLIPLPTLPEQKAIAEILSDMDAEIEALEKKRDKYKAIKQGMMQELLTGRIRLVD